MQKNDLNIVLALIFLVGAVVVIGGLIAAPVIKTASAQEEAPANTKVRTIETPNKGVKTVEKQSAEPSSNAAVERESDSSKLIREEEDDSTPALQRQMTLQLPNDKTMEKNIQSAPASSASVSEVNEQANTIVVGD